MNTAKQIYLLQLFSNGDCLYATTVARQIKQDYPDCQLTWIIASFCKNIIDNNPYVDNIWEIPNVSKTNYIGVIKNIKKELQQKKKEGKIYDFFILQGIDSFPYYDGCIRSVILRGYRHPITVPLTPVLRLRNEEIERAKKFAENNNLKNYKNIILFEFAPQSGQLAMTSSIAIGLAKEIIKNKDAAIILSSGIKIGEQDKKIIDGSVLTIRETAALTHYCTLLLGCSSGITWVSTSDAAKPLPMIQILDANALWVNSVSRDFERFGFSNENILEIYEFNTRKIVECIGDVLNTGFQYAKNKYYTPLPLQFKTTRRSIYNMLCFLQFKAIIKHIRINKSIYGWHPLLIKEIILGFITSPFKLIYNITVKSIRKVK